MEHPNADKTFGPLLACTAALLLYAGSLAAQPGDTPNRTGTNTSTISGTVKAADTGLPLSDVNVFLSNTNLGSATDRDGNYTIKQVPNGTYKLVFSYVGFKNRIMNVNLLEQDSYTYNASLSPEPIELDELSVTAERDREWERNLKIFREQFIGTTHNASDTEIMNPEILEFEWNESGSVLSASAEKELHIVNRALGYDIHVVLTKFEYIARDRSRNMEDLVEYLMYPRYRELPDSLEDGEAQWRENRREAYLGSLRHFLYSLYHDRIRDEGFQIDNGLIQRLDPSTENYYLRYQPLNPEYKRRLKGYQLQSRSSRRPLTVTYENRQVSYLVGSENNVFFVDQFGKLLDVRSLVVGGVWYQTRLADELPLTYTLQENRMEN